MMEFQGIIMAAGKGSRMMEITSGIPKCLLPVGNTPLIKYPLHTLKEAGIHDIIILVLEGDKLKVQEALENYCNLKLDIVAIPSKEEWGTADSLRYIKDKIKTDIIVLSCDLVTDFDLQKMANLHRTHDSSLTMLVAPMATTLKDAPIPGYKSKPKPEKDIIGMDKTGRLMFVSSEADFEEGVPVKLSILKRHPVIEVCSSLMDAHLYIMKKGLVDFLGLNGNISTLKGELLPVVVGKQFHHKQNVSCQEADRIGNLGPSANARKAPNDFQKCIQEDELKKVALELSSWNDHWGTLEGSYHGDLLRCFAFISKEGFCMRANTLIGYAEINRQISKCLPLVTAVQQKIPVKQYLKSQVDSNSIVGDGCEFADKVSIKKSAVGNHCKLKEKVKVINSIIMSHVTIEEGCNIQGSIICNNVSIGQHCDLKECIIGPGQEIKASSKYTHDVLQTAYQLMEI